VTARLVRLGAVMGVVLGLLVLACVPWLPSVFSHDTVVRGLIASSLVVVAIMQPLAGPVFVLDGVLIGAGDGRWLAGAGLVMLVAFVPAAYLVLARDLGVVGLWWALTWFMVVRGALLAWRSRGDAWLRTSGGSVDATESAALGDAGG
jgi:Na+-driven multidrug efflux pump